MTYYQDIAHTAIGQYFAAQNQDELAVFLRLVDSWQARRVLEIGTFAGGLSWALAQLPTVDQVITIDMATRYRDVSPKIKFINGLSTASETLSQVVEMLNGVPVDLLVIDGGHESYQVAGDWDAYQGFVHNEGMIMFHDVNEWNHHPEIQVRKEWLRIAGPYPHVEICADRYSSPGTGVMWLM